MDVLIVDANTGRGDTFARHLASWDATATVARDGEEASMALLHGRFDLVIYFPLESFSEAVAFRTRAIGHDAVFSAAIHSLDDRSVAALLAAGYDDVFPADDAPAHLRARLGCLLHGANSRSARTSHERSESEARFQAIFDEAALGIVLTDLHPRILQANEAFATMLGRSADSLRGTPITEISHPGDFAAEMRAAEALLSGNTRTMRHEKRYRHADGHWLWGRLNLSLIRDVDGAVEYALAIVEDITPQKLAEEGRNEAEAAQRKAEESVLRHQETLRQMLELEERERQHAVVRIDDLAQSLTGAAYQLESTGRLLPPGDGSRSAYRKGMRLVQECLVEARRLVSNLHPPVLDHFGLVQALEHLVNEHARPGGPAIHFTAPPEIPRLVEPLETTAFRIVQAALANAVEHSRSPDIEVELFHDEQTLRLAVRDRGLGFDPGLVEDERFGLRALRERARLVGGRAVVDSAPGAGTRIHVELPLRLRPAVSSDPNWDEP